MSEKPFGYALICDDIRNEVGGKVSLMGIYGTHLVVEERFPVRLPKLGFFIVMILPRALDIKTLSIRIYTPGNDDDDAPDIEGEVAIRPPTQEAKAPYLRFTQSLLFSEVVLDRPGKIRVRALCDGELIKLGVLFVQGSGAKEEASVSTDDGT
ncbi:MAG: hypothetical protein WD852_05875 [Methyloceanibacter sp.]